MERIVHGHFADPNSTRDINGITPSEFEFLVRCIQQYHMSIVKFVEASPEEQESFLQSIAASSLVTNEGISENRLREAVEKVKEQFESDYNTSYEFLKAINQPYPGAEY